MKAFSSRVRPGIRRASLVVAWKATADVVGKLVTLVVTVAAARTLTPEDFGVFALAMTAGWLLGVASDAGLSMFVAREAARRGNDLRGIWTEVLRLRTLLAVCAFAVAAAAVWMTLPSTPVRAFLVIVTAQLVAATLETVFHVFRGLERAEIEASIHTTTRLVTLALASLMLSVDGRLSTLAIALVIPPSLGLLWALGRVDGLLVPGSRVDRRYLGARRFIAEVAPIGAGALISALYFRCDVFFVEWWHGLTAVASYNAAFRLVEAMRLLPAAVLAVAFPTLVRAMTLGPGLALGAGLAGTGFAAGAGVFFGAAFAIDVLYGPRYLDAVPALQALAFAVPFFFLNYALTSQVIAWNGQRAYLAIAIGALVTNIAANLLLVPPYAGVGAALATIATEVVVTVGCLAALAGAGRWASRTAVAEAPS